MRQYAISVGLDMERYDYEMSTQLYFQRIREQIETGFRSHVRATPTLFVTGEVLNTSFAMKQLSPMAKRKEGEILTSLAI